MAAEEEEERDEVSAGAEELGVVAEAAQAIEVELDAGVVLGRIVPEEVEDEDVPHDPVGEHE
jgi:hypothetical protein